MIKLYRYVYIFDGKYYPLPHWYRMDKKLIFDALFDRAMIFNYINGDKNIEWFMEFKDVEENETSNDKLYTK